MHGESKILIKEPGDTDNYELSLLNARLSLQYFKLESNVRSTWYDLINSESIRRVVPNTHLRYCVLILHIFSRVLRDSTPRFVGPSVRWSVRPSVRRSVGPSVGPSVRHTLLFFGFLRFLALLLLPKWSGDLNYGPCPPARDWGSRVSGLVLLQMKSILFCEQ